MADLMSTSLYAFNRKSRVLDSLVAGVSASREGNGLLPEHIIPSFQHSLKYCSVLSTLHFALQTFCTSSRVYVSSLLNCTCPYRLYILYAGKASIERYHGHARSHYVSH